MFGTFAIVVIVLAVAAQLDRVLVVEAAQPELDTGSSQIGVAVVEADAAWAALPWELWFSWVPFLPAPSSALARLDSIKCHPGGSGGSDWVCDDLHGFWFVRRAATMCSASESKCHLSISLGVRWFNSVFVITHFALFSIAFATSVCAFGTMLSLWRNLENRRALVLIPIGHLIANLAILYFNMYATYSRLSHNCLICALALFTHTLVAKSSVLFYSILFDEVLPEILRPKGE